MSALALASLLLLGTPLPATVDEPLVLVVHAPYASASSPIDVASILATARATLRPELRVWLREAPDTPELRRAGGDIAALLRVLRPDLTHARDARDPCGPPEPSEHSPRLLWVLTVLHGPGGLRLSSRLAEVHTAACALRSAADPQAMPDEGIDLAQAPTVTVADTRALDAYVASMLRDVVAPALRRAGFARGRGTLTIEGTQPGDVVNLDGRVLGAAADARVEISEIPPGEHHLVLTRVGGPVLDTRVVQLDGAASVVDVLALSPPSLGRAATRWAGVALVVAGGALAVSGALIDDERYRCVDFATSAEACPDAPWRSLGRGGPAWVPLGLALVGAGAALGVGPALLETEAELPWRSMVAGAAVGALTYALSVALAPAPPDLTR